MVYMTLANSSHLEGSTGVSIWKECSGIDYQEQQEVGNLIEKEMMEVHWKDGIELAVFIARTFPLKSIETGYI